jgi:hypothetical protein
MRNANIMMENFSVVNPKLCIRDAKHIPLLGEWKSFCCFFHLLHLSFYLVLVLAAARQIWGGCEVRTKCFADSRHVHDFRVYLL